LVMISSFVIHTDSSLDVVQGNGLYLN